MTYQFSSLIIEKPFLLYHDQEDVLILNVLEDHHEGLYNTLIMK